MPKHTSTSKPKKTPVWTIISIPAVFVLFILIVPFVGGATFAFNSSGHITEEFAPEVSEVDLDRSAIFRAKVDSFTPSNNLNFISDIDDTLNTVVYVTSGETTFMVFYEKDYDGPMTEETFDGSITAADGELEEGKTYFFQTEDGFVDGFLASQIERVAIFDEPYEEGMAVAYPAEFQDYLSKQQGMQFAYFFLPALLLGLIISAAYFAFALARILKARKAGS